MRAHLQPIDSSLSPMMATERPLLQRGLVRFLLLSSFNKTFIELQS